MKKVLLLIVALFLAACGGGGGSTTTDVTGSTPTGALSIKFEGQQGAAKTVGGVTTILAHNRVRVIITNPNLRLNGGPFKAIQDVPAPGGTFNFSLPLASGYLVEALTYNEISSTEKVPVEYAVAKMVSVVSGDPAVNQVNLVLQPVEAKLQVPGTVLQGGKVSVLANLSSASGRSNTPLQSAWYMPQPTSTAVTFNNRTSAYMYKGFQTVTAWTVTGPGEKMFFQGMFTLKSYMLFGTETLKMWKFGAPAVGFGNVTTAILAPVNVSFPAP